VLVGNVPFAVAVAIALLNRRAVLVIGRATGKPVRTLEIGRCRTLWCLTVLTLALSESFMARWIQPLSQRRHLSRGFSWRCSRQTRSWLSSPPPNNLRRGKTELSTRHHASDVDLVPRCRHGGVVGDPADLQGQREDSPTPDFACRVLPATGSFRLAAGRGGAGLG